MKPLVLACMIIGAAAVVAPNYMKGLLPQDSEDAASGVLPASAARSSGDVFEVTAAGDGHFYLDAEVNWRDVRFIVDTGATVVALRMSDAEAAGIRLVPADFDKPVGTANGTTYAAEVELDSVSVGQLEVPAVRALVIRDDQLQISLLGGSFLNQLKRFEIASGKLVLEN